MGSWGKQGEDARKEVSGRARPPGKSGRGMEGASRGDEFIRPLGLAFPHSQGCVERIDAGSEC